MNELVPGTLFVGLMALVAFMIGDIQTIFILGLGCAAGWQSFNPSRAQLVFYWSALVLWTIAVLILAYRIFL